MDIDDSRSCSSEDTHISIDSHQRLKSESPEPTKLSSPPKKRSAFFIDDILSKDFDPPKPQPAIVRPWDLPQELPTQRPVCKSEGKKKGSPLDALLKLTSKTFEGLEKSEKRADDQASPQNGSSGSSSNGSSKKKRKSRTAFTNHQVFQLERRFLCQKYLSPADRDEIAQSLGLSNAQVITWFQNRRAKMKRDMEELRKDVTATRMHALQKSLCFSDIDILRAKYLVDYKRLN